MSSLILVLLSLTAVTVNSDKPLNKAIGDKVVLTPDSVSSPITSITWKHGPDIAVEWYNGQTQAYRHFEGRVMLNNSNGELTITGLTLDDSGSYTAEINDKPPTKPTQLQVISPVSKPSVSTWCHPDMTYCTLTCEGNTRDAEPITYKWRTSDTVTTNVLNITKEEDEPWFGCSLQNPVSSESSEDVPSPFTKDYKAIGDKVVLTPDSVSSPITNITWNHGPDVAVVWYNGQTQAYRHFKGRVMLNNLNGELTITGLTPDDSGSYTAEINNKPPTKPTQLQVISRVSKPSVSTWCHPDMTYCTLTCEGNTTEAEPITYEWRTSDASWESTNVLNITKGEDEPWFGCSLQNPVSSESSEDVPSPFTKVEWVQVIIILIAVLLGILMVGFIYVNYKRREEATTVDWVQAIIFLITLLGGILMVYFMYVKYKHREVDWVEVIILLLGLLEWTLMVCFIYVFYKYRKRDWEWIIYFLTGLSGGIPLVCFLYVRYKHRKGVVYLKMTGRTGRQEETEQWDWVQMLIILIAVLGGFLMMYFMYVNHKDSVGNWVQVIISVMVPILFVAILMVDSCRFYDKHRKVIFLQMIIILMTLLGGILMVYFINVNYTRIRGIWVGVIIGSITALVVLGALMMYFIYARYKYRGVIWLQVMDSLMPVLGWTLMVYLMYDNYKESEVIWLQVIIILLGVLGGILIMCYFFVDNKHIKAVVYLKMTGRTERQEQTVQLIWLQVIIFLLGLLELILAVYFIYLYYKHREVDWVGLIISVILLLLVVVVFVTVMVDCCWFYYKHRKERSEMLQNAEAIPLQEPDTNNEAVVILEVQKPQTQHSASPVSTETSKETEVPKTQDPTLVGSSDTSDETEKPSEISETSDQDPTSHASNKTENSAVVSGDQETVGQEPPVDEQAAEDPRDDDQS